MDLDAGNVLSSSKEMSGVCRSRHTAKCLLATCLSVVPRVQGVVYFTRSLVEMENENVVNSAIEYVTTVQQTKIPRPDTELDLQFTVRLCRKRFATDKDVFTHRVQR